VVLKTNRPCAGLGILVTSRRLSIDTCGINIPLLVLFTCRRAAAFGLAVPIPTFWAFVKMVLKINKLVKIK
jgi:hypothetical protein